MPRRSTRLRLPVLSRNGWLFALALLLQLGAGAAAAQTARVSVRDAQSGAPVAAAMVRVEDAAGVVVRAGFTRPDGTVQLRIAAGVYQVLVRRAGYQEGSAELRVEGPGVSLNVRLRPRPLSLDTVRVVAPGEGPERGRDAFLRRSLTEEGVFLDPAYLAGRYHSTYLGDLLQGVPDLAVVAPVCVSRRGSTSLRSGCAGRLAPRKPVSTRGWGCITTLLNGIPPRLGASNPEYGHNEIDFWLRPRDIVGVEVYHVPGDIPPDLRQYAQPHCGMINYWTRSGW